MKIVQILRSETDDITRMFIREFSEGEDNIEVSLNQEGVDYAQLVKDIFESDQVISWW